MINNSVRNWLFCNFYNPGRSLKIIYSLIIMVIMAMIAILISKTIGSNSVFSHAMYFPILLAAILFKIPGGIAAGFLSGLSLLLFPANIVTANGMHNLSDWFIQIGFYVVIGTVAGSMVAILENQMHKNEWLLLHNPRTGIPNTEYLYKEIEEAIRENRFINDFSMNVVILTNYFEIINTLGVEFGDLLTHKVVEHLKRHLGKSITVCQLGLDMLGFIMPTSKHPENKTLKIIKSLGKSFQVRNIPVYAEGILGQSNYPEHGDKPTTLFQKAVIAAEIAKGDNKQCFTYDVERDNTSVENFELLGEVSGAIGKNQFEFFYQPMIETRTRRPIGAEALIRWRHPEKGLISPLKFIPKLEMTGLIYALTRWGIPISLNQIAEWEKHGLKVNISINISVKNLQDPDFVESVENLLKNVPFEHKRLELEITERAFLMGFEEAVKNLERLKALGVSISIDDFGTGFSTLDSLKKCPIDYIKIDKIFIDDILKNEKDRAIVQATITMAKDLGITVVAEGVEDQQTLDLLTKMGCDQVQGYFISRPIPESQATAWLLKNTHDKVEQPI